MSYAIVMRDLDFNNGFEHWAIWDIPSGVLSLPEDVGISDRRSPGHKSGPAGIASGPPPREDPSREVGVRDLFAHAMREAGLSAVLGSGLIARSLRDVGASVETANEADYARALPRLEARLKTYLDPEQVSRIGTMLRDALGEAAR